MSWLWVTYGMTEGFHNSSSVEFWVCLRRVRKNPYLNINRMIFVWAGQTYHTDKVGYLVLTDFLSTSLCNGLRDNTKSPQYCSGGLIMVLVYHNSSGNSIVITQTPVYLITGKQWENLEQIWESSWLDKYGWQFNWWWEAKEQLPRQCKAL